MPTVILIEGLVKSYGEHQAVDGVDLSIEKGEIFALLGPNGAGKTTIVEILEGYRVADGGKVLVLGEDPAAKGRAGAALRGRIGIVLQDSSDSQDLTVLETLQHFATYYSAPRNVDELISLVNLEEKSQAKIRTLSGGQRRRLDVALGIIGQPEILFLDEPTTGFDPRARRDFWDLILALKNNGTTILLTTHYLDEAEALADRVGVIVAGKILEISTPATLGGRMKALTTVSWQSLDGQIESVESDKPTEIIRELIKKFDGEIPALSITRPSLEEIYLKMIGEK
ncbi:MAG: ABC transporter ATP-binding protein [Actinobacteria bacterium]|nr:ABC transporter ATP-binding protein [Actinomycetota bacterium]MDA2985151.1 ABC transporter ATP-binding protein [Actinomycetota bacterium]